MIGTTGEDYQKATGAINGDSEYATPSEAPAGKIPSFATILARVGKLAKRDYWLPDVEHGHCGDWASVCQSTKTNAQDTISFIQTMEGALCEIHGMLQRVNELVTRKANGTITAADIASIDREIEQLIAEIDSCQAFTAFDEFCFLDVGGQTFHAPMGCPRSCHHDWTIKSMEPIRDLSADSTILDVQGAIERVSEYRAMLGANQNALEHVVTVCESLQNDGFGSGIEHADSTSGDTHHVLIEDLSSGQTFLAEWALMDHRVAELEEKKSNLHDDRDIKHIDMEIAALGVAKDFLIDLLCDVMDVDETVLPPCVTNQVWTNPDSVPAGPEDDPNWGWDYDAPVGSDLYYRTVIHVGAMESQDVDSVLQRGLVLDSGNASVRNLILSCLVGRITPDYDTLKVYKDGKELVEGEDYRLYVSGFHMYSDDHDPEHAADISTLMALRDRIQHTWCPYHTFGLIFSNELMPAGSISDDGVLDLLGRASPAYEPGSSDIVITYKAELDVNAFLVDGDAGGHTIEANGMPVRLAAQSNTVTLGSSAMPESEFEALIGGAGDNKLPRFAGSEDIDVDAIEESGVIPGPATGNMGDAGSGIREMDVANVYNYGIDIVSLDAEDSKPERNIFGIPGPAN